MGYNNGGYTVFLNLTPAEFRHISALVNYSESAEIVGKLKTMMKFDEDVYRRATDALYEAVRHAEDRVEYGYE